MNTMKSVKLIKRLDRGHRRRTAVKPAVGPTEWSKSVRSWVVEFQNTDHSESLPAFDSLFKDTEVSSIQPEK
jgi:hypothetical protein